MDRRRARVKKDPQRHDQNDRSDDTTTNEVSELLRRGGRSPSPRAGDPLFTFLFQGAQINEHLLNALIAFAALLLHRLVHDPLELHRHITAQCRERRRVLTQDRIHHRRAERTVKRQPSRRHLIEHDAQRPDIRSLIDLLRARLLWRHIRQRPEGHTGLRQDRRRRRLRQAEVHDLDLTLVGQHQIAALDVPMSDAFLVRGV